VGPVPELGYRDVPARQRLTALAIESATALPFRCLALVERAATHLGRLPAITLLVTAAATGAYLVPGAREFLQLEREAILSGQVWRLVTCNIAHVDAGHFWLDVGTFALLGAACELRGRRSFLLALLLSALIPPLAVLVFIPNMVVFCGLSAPDTALYVLLAVEVLRRSLGQGSRFWAFAAGIALAAEAFRIGFELLTGRALFASGAAPGFVTVPLAHLLGVGAGVLAGAFDPGDFGGLFGRRAPARALR
jgi:rhomboid family GlyGly-CTERM serine protease